MVTSVGRILSLGSGALLLFMIVWPIAAGNIPAGFGDTLQTLVLAGAAAWLIWTGMSTRSGQRRSKHRGQSA
jgi:hypothetical protein